MDRAGSRWGFVARMDSPSARLLFAGCNECAQAEKMINSPNKRMHAAIFHTDVPQIFQRFLLAEIHKFAFELCTDHDCFCGEMMSRVILNSHDMIRRVVAGTGDPGLV